METRPIKGTTPRDPDPAADRAAALELTEDPKFVGENLMIVDLLRNDMSMVCEVGTVEVTDLMHVESYPSVHQLVTTIRGRLRPDVLELAGAARAVPGRVDDRRAEAAHDGDHRRRRDRPPRGVYSGAIGWLLDDGSADLGIVIRTLVHRRRPLHARHRRRRHRPLGLRRRSTPRPVEGGQPPAPPCGL